MQRKEVSEVSLKKQEYLDMRIALGVFLLFALSLRPSIPDLFAHLLSVPPLSVLSVLSILSSPYSPSHFITPPPSVPTASPYPALSVLPHALDSLTHPSLS